MEQWLVGIAASAWVLPALFVFCTLDGFFPPVPSESAVIALAALSVTSGSPPIAGIAVAAAIGAFCGDQIAYTIGRRIELSRIRWLRDGRGAQAVEALTTRLRERGASVVITARFIPVGRVAANIAAGSMGFPRAQFVAADLIAASVWSAYGIALGAFAGVWLRDNPLLAAVVGVVIGLSLGVVIDRFTARRGR